MWKQKKTVGHLHAGYGKMKIHDDHDLADFRTIVAIHNDYISAEKYISPNKNIEPIDTEIELENGSKLKVQKFPYQYDFRIQKIGDHYRLLKRHCFSGWKGNVEGFSHSFSILFHFSFSQKIKNSRCCCA